MKKGSAFPQRLQPPLAFLWGVMLLFATEISAEIVAGPVPDNARSIGGGVSVGTNLEKDADFYGWTIDYGTGLASGWSFTFSLAYDKETERQSGKPDKVTQSYTPTLIWSNPFDEHWSVFVGLAKGLFDDSEKEDSFELTKLDADWATGVGLSYLLYRNGPHNFSVSGTLEYKISDGEFAASTDVGYAYFF